MCLLAIIEEEPSYGYEMADKLAQRGLHLTSEGSIYPTLSRMQRNSLIEGFFVEADGSGPPRKYYRMAPEGRKRLEFWSLDQVVERCRGYWSGSGVTAEAVDEMAGELRTHLQEAAAAGKSIETVTGPDVEAFTEEWAMAFRGPRPSRTTTLPSPRSNDSRAPGWALWIGALAISALVALVALFGPSDDGDIQGTWIGIWLVSAALLAVGEMLTAGFFLLPFAVGAAAAGALALASITPPIQIIVFVIVSVVSLWMLQQFAHKDRQGELMPVGAARYIGSSALVIERVSRLTGTGRVMMGTEDWRATTDGADIDVDAEVKVVEVRGTRLVVERVSN